MPISEVIASHVPTMARSVMASQAKLVATEAAKPGLGALAQDTLQTGASKALGALASDAAHPGPIGKGFWWLFDKAANVVYNVVHKAAYGH